MAHAQLSVDEVGRRLKIGVVQVYDLFNELHDLFRLIHQVLKESEADIHPLTSKGFVLPKDRKTSQPADRLMKSDMGLLAEIGIDSTEDNYEEDVVDDEGDDDGGEGDETDRREIAITPDRRFLGVRAILIDPKEPTADPVIVAGVFGSLSLSRSRRTGAAPVSSSFRLRRAALKRPVKLLTPGLSINRPLTYRVKGGHLSWNVSALDTSPLATFATRADVDAFVERVVRMVAD